MTKVDNVYKEVKVKRVTVQKINSRQYLKLQWYLRSGLKDIRAGDLVLAELTIKHNFGKHLNVPEGLK